MVNVDPALYLAEMAKRRTNDAGLSEWDRDMIGRAAVRLEIPFADLDQVAMRDVADILRGLANAMDFWSRRSDLSQREILLYLRASTREAVHRMRSLKEGRRAPNRQDEAAVAVELARANTVEDSGQVMRLQHLRRRPLPGREGNT
jgi:hypothetical protein